jgi:hypothetical protein
MKNLFKAVLLLSFAIFAFSWAACGGKNDKKSPDSNSIIGTWENVDGEFKIRIELNSNGQYVTYKSESGFVNYISKGKFTNTAAKLILETQLVWSTDSNGNTIADDSEFVPAQDLETVFSYTLSANSLTMYDEQTGKQITFARTANAADPISSIEPTEPVDPTEPTNPTEPTEPVDPSDPTDPTNPSDPDPTDPPDPTNSDAFVGVWQKSQSYLMTRFEFKANGEFTRSDHNTGLNTLLTCQRGMFDATSEYLNLNIQYEWSINDDINGNGIADDPEFRSYNTSISVSYIFMDSHLTIQGFGTFASMN